MMITISMNWIWKAVGNFQSPLPLNILLNGFLNLFRYHCTVLVLNTSRISIQLVLLKTLAIRNNELSLLCSILELDIHRV